ncbi:MAG: glycosyltransferase family 39 protein [Candidatus Omnitrophica bacterium]|nr:glycosyltransferase family 39 protein [Candidatus Omnitrophota bacterium]
MKNTYFPLHWFFLIVVLVLVMALPFADKPFHIDDAFVLKITDNILQNPFDPFAGDFDWFGHETPIWKTTTNPPFISYFLAPFAARFGYSEIALHCAMMTFLLLIAWSMVVLSHRFAGGSIYPLLFVLFSPAVMVSGNVMRDIPAAGLAMAAVALFIMGTDREKRLFLFLGSIAAGLAIVTKYSAAIVVPVLLIYPLFKRKFWVWLWIAPALLVLLAWCIQNIALYDQIHLVYLTMHRPGDSGVGWIDKTCGALVVLGSMIYLLPAMIWSEAKRRRWIVFMGCLPVGLALFWGIQRRFDWDADGEYLLWALTGGLLLYLCLAEGMRRGVRYWKQEESEYAGDSLFLFAWLCAPILFSILFVPFQAVRHQILALPPLMLLGWRAVYRAHKEGWLLKVLVGVLFAMQATVGYMTAAVDYQHASAYPYFAKYAKEKYASPDHQTWFVGHWGWKYYAEREGFRMRHAGGELPEPGDIVLWPLRVHYGDCWSDLHDGSAFRILESAPLEEIELMSPIPLRVQNFYGASFYALTGENIPYRFFHDYDLETLKVYRVKNYNRQDVLNGERRSS